jgi:hypothetical protein
MAEEYISPEKAQFNQANYQQIRINELLLRVDRLNTNPTDFSDEVGLFNYEIIFNDLCSVLSTISAKLTKLEKAEMKMKKEFLTEKISKYPVYKKKLIQGWRTETKTYFYPEVWNALNKLIFDFRLRLEDLMNIHGFGNPTKKDPRTEFQGAD